MPRPGTKPTDGPKVGTTPLAHDWLEVVNVPYTGKKPSLSKTMPAATKAWWRDVTRLPHCALWHAGDWRFALDTARVHAAFVNGDNARAAELRLRERAMGTTTDALRDLRIKYVDREIEQPKPADTAVDFAAERRRRLTDAS